MGASFSAAVRPAVLWLWFREGYGSHSFAQPASHAAHGNYPLLGKPRSLTAAIREARRAMLERALAEGPRALDTRERRIVPLDPEKSADLHRRVWNLSDRVRARRWGRPGPRDERW